MTETRTCPICREAIPADTPGPACPRCLLVAGFALAAPEPLSAEEVAELFPDHEILGVLGRGGMGVVFKARQKALDRIVALKVLPPDLAAAPGFENRFQREARALARLTHPNIVQVFEFGERDGVFFLVMEYVDGVNVRQAMRDGRLRPDEALAIVPQICDALQYAHEQGVVHRDIKPENVLVDLAGRVKVADFGIAKIVGADAAALGLTQTGQVMGTPHYMAPEQFERPTTVDHRADIYSLGVVFYEMLTGELPLGLFPPPSSKVTIDVRLDEVVLRSLEKAPERRWQHAADVRTEMDVIADSPPVAEVDVEFAPRTSKLAATSFVLSLAGLLFGAVVLANMPPSGQGGSTVGFFVLGGTTLCASAALAGSITGVISWNRIAQSRGALLGRGLAVAGTFLPLLGCLIPFALAALTPGITPLVYPLDKRAPGDAEPADAEVTAEPEPLRKGVERLLRAAIAAGPDRARLDPRTYLTAGSERARNPEVARFADRMGAFGLGRTPDTALGAPLADFAILRLGAEEADGTVEIVLVKDERKLRFRVAREAGRWRFTWAPVRFEHGTSFHEAFAMLPYPFAGELVRSGPAPEPAPRPEDPPEKRTGDDQVQDLVARLVTVEKLEDALALYGPGPSAWIAGLNPAVRESRARAGELGLPLLALTPPGWAARRWPVAIAFDDGEALIAFSDGETVHEGWAVLDRGRWKFDAAHVTVREGPGRWKLKVAAPTVSHATHPAPAPREPLAELAQILARRSATPSRDDMIALYAPDDALTIEALAPDEVEREAQQGRLGMPLAPDVFLGGAFRTLELPLGMDPERFSAQRGRVVVRAVFGVSEWDCDVERQLSGRWLFRATPPRLHDVKPPEAPPRTDPGEGIVEGVARLLRAAIDAGPDRAKLAPDLYVSRGSKRAADGETARLQDEAGANGLGHTPDFALGGPLGEFAVSHISALPTGATRVSLSRGSQHVIFSVAQENGRWCFTWDAVWIDDMIDAGSDREPPTARGPYPWDGEIVHAGPAPETPRPGDPSDVRYSSVQVHTLLRRLASVRALEDALRLYGPTARAWLSGLEPAERQARAKRGELGAPLLALEEPDWAARRWMVASTYTDTAALVVLTDGKLVVEVPYAVDRGRWGFAAAQVAPRPQATSWAKQTGTGISAHGRTGPARAQSPREELDVLVAEFAKRKKDPSFSSVFALYDPDDALAMEAMEEYDYAPKSESGALGLPLAPDEWLGAHPRDATILSADFDAGGRSAQLVIAMKQARFRCQVGLTRGGRWRFRATQVERLP